MHVRWTPIAADDLEHICDYIKETSPDTARRVASILLEGIGTLTEFPNRGRVGRINGTRELVFTPLPFVAVYEIHTEVRILRILHGAQRWP